MAAQDQILNTNRFKKILKEIRSKYRVFKEYEDTADHLTSGCPILARMNTSQGMIKCAHIYITQDARK
jgi:hypothetical protein